MKGHVYSLAAYIAGKESFTCSKQLFEPEFITHEKAVCCNQSHTILQDTENTYCADCLKMWEPQPPGTLRACPGL